VEDSCEHGSLHLVSLDQHVSPVYASPHLQGMLQIPETLSRKSSFTGLSM
jgi:hypothetical protein